MLTNLSHEMLADATRRHEWFWPCGPVGLMLRTAWVVVRRIARVLAARVDGHGVLGDVDGDDLPGVDAA